MLLSLSGTMVVSVVVGACYGQDCITASQKCADTYQCCGGCCINGKCIDTYRDCRLKESPCDTSGCPPGYDCRIFQPSDACVGCEATKLCQLDSHNQGNSFAPSESAPSSPLPSAGIGLLADLENKPKPFDAYTHSTSTSIANDIKLHLLCFITFIINIAIMFSIIL